ncbi:hypothetical protein GCM10010399_82490 [Dactylosporangium fulvum]|uniref:DUF2190 family protein n=1 Tax=Dactylosporangium fulvum TaxID=53359 RepID=A0ABY5W9J1_9ACTN|nr:hypothetical protein [Dactylosporangium fulvum]UWP85879.1 hypothetical protein Dfulv_17170 [Dactylosporangium fulvum]
MTDYVGVFPTNAAAAQLCTPVAVASGDRIDGADILNGAVFIVSAGGTPTNVTFVDPGKTPAGTVAGAVTPVTVAANTSRCWGYRQLVGYIDPATNKVTANYSSTATIGAMVVG